MKAIAEGLYQRGKGGTKYVRLRIPAAARQAYPKNQTHVVRSLRTADPREAKRLFRAEAARIEAEFKAATEKVNQMQPVPLTVRRVRTLSDAQLKAVCNYWIRSVLLTDEWQRSQGLLDDEDFEDLGAKLIEQRRDLGQKLAQGRSDYVMPALHAFLYCCGLDMDFSQEEAQRVGYAFLRAIVQTLDHQLARQRGEVVPTDDVAPDAPHPALITNPKFVIGPTWADVFELWRGFVPNRPKSTAIAAQTPWRDLEIFAARQGVNGPQQVTPVLMSAFVDAMRKRGLAVKTINERLNKVKAIFKIAVGKHKLPSNPAADTLGAKLNSLEKRQKRRLPFDNDDLQQLFGSQVFVEHKRSRGQAGEASYWIPVLMFYTGARPEELAGLAVGDICHDQKYGWYLNLIDQPSIEDDVFDTIPNSHRRTLKNAPSIRKIPIAQQLIDLGLLRYVEWIRKEGHGVLFPRLKPDWHGKLSGAFSKWFGRYKKSVGIGNPKKVLYSFRHTMKDLLEQAQVSTKYLQRILGHTSGDGAVTDGYGSDVPLEVLFAHFSRVRFPSVPITPWKPGTGGCSLKKSEGN
ncbi:putative integrase [Thiomonas arsenitoxydans]|uniref:Integrase n=1 Tax=Thiomonas arsenitoxydans (strain DSM 22701 / CIP 110005 / 3As) TaxID=426114 RepID=D6CQ63_THIA3|nr:DUF6538 domain-containing protein [Thiomonas arsenitoxydans]CAZ88143.1 putative integrase [Thiomonas arsenitoxydans]CQR32483.1 putative integrase [Thiomonas arsenitoxydans]CQR32827.1 putative integrase [Thiomonas arsenitoxydans]CQR34176.1 putative integrase [Thiomonas arsenitoxydans]CQR40457.1 putative integrase [Thiomonas arsenitoxydans]